jgi:hypothetical protein
LFCIIGCIEKAPQLSQATSHLSDDQVAGEWPTYLRMDFDAQASSNLFSVRGNIMLTGTGSLPYLMLNATLRQGGQVLKNTKYLMLQVESGKDHSFEITKNLRILPGSYNCTLEVTGPKGSLARETRKCKLAGPMMESEPLVNLILPDELAIRIAEQKYEEEKIQREANQEKARKEAIQEKETTREKELQEKKVQEKETSNESKDEAKQETDALEARASSEVNIAAKEGSQAYTDENHINSTSRSGASLKKSMVPPIESKTELIGSSTSKKYHLPACRFASKIKPDNKIRFESIEDAKGQGYLPCKVCNP